MRTLKLVDEQGRVYWSFPECELFYLFNYLDNRELSYQMHMLKNGLERWADRLDAEE